mgnify:CR=1 FL=1
MSMGELLNSIAPEQLADMYVTLYQIRTLSLLDVQTNWIM